MSFHPIADLAMKRLFPTISLLILIGSLFTASCQNPNSNEEGEITMLNDSLSIPSPDSVRTIRITAVGDMMCHSPQFKLAKVAEDTFDFRPYFEEIGDVLASADFTIGNLETTFAGKDQRYQGYPTFNTPDDYLDAIIETGFDFLVTSNNHSLDHGEAAVYRTLEVLDANDMPHTGTFDSQEDRDSIRIVSIHGITMAILNYTYGMNGFQCPEGKDWLVNEIDSTLIIEDIAAAKALSPDLVCVFLHFGAEYIHEPNIYQREYGELAMAHGADIIFGAHPHVVQPVDFFKTEGGTLDSGFVAWSMGNFVSNQSKPDTDAGVIVNVEITKDYGKDTIYISDASYVPTWVYRGKNKEKPIHVILPAEKGLADSSYSYLSADQHARMKAAYEKTQGFISKYHPIRTMKLEEWKSYTN